MNGIWSSANIADTPADIYDPPGPTGPRFGILHLHGVGLETLRDKPALTDLLAVLNLACVCPHGQRSWWGDRVCSEFDARITPERHLLDNVLPFFRQRWELSPRAIGLQG